MALARTITHPFVSAIPDGADATLVRPSNWNATHTAALSGAISGGIPYFDSTTTEATSALLAANGVIIGGGAGAAPFTNGNLTYSGGTFQVTATATNTKPLIAKGTGTTTVNVLEVQDSAAAVNLGIYSEGMIVNKSAGAVLSKIVDFKYLGSTVSTIDYRGFLVAAGINTDTAFVAPPSNGTVTLGYGTVGWKAIYTDYTNTATVGNVTINKAGGKAIIAAGAASVVITNSLATAAARCMAVLETTDATAVAIKTSVCAAGNITISVNAVATGNTTLSFQLINAD